MPDQIMSDSNVVDVLQELATVCRDSQEGYKTAAEEAEDPELRSEFQDLARKRGQEADELDRLIRENGGEPAPRSGSLSGQAHRMFVSLRSALSSSDRAAVLNEVARGESYAEAAFDKAKRHALSGRLGETVQRLHDSVKQSRDKFRRMLQAEGGSGVLGGQASLQTVTRYVSEQPVMSTFVALGLGFLIGALTMMMSRPGRNNGAGSNQGRDDGRRASHSGSGGYTGRRSGREGYRSDA